MRVERAGKPLLQVLALRRIDGAWALPGAFSASADVTLTNIMKKAFGMDHRLLPAALRKDIKNMQVLLQEHAELLYHGYMDDPRNTDNAWVETQASFFHDETGVLSKLEIMDCPDQGFVWWLLMLCVVFSVVVCCCALLTCSHDGGGVDCRTSLAAFVCGAQAVGATRGSQDGGVLLMTILVDIEMFCDVFSWLCDFLCYSSLHCSRLFSFAISEK